MKIKDIKADQGQIELFARVEKVITSTATNGNAYMIIHLTDSTGKIEARKWIVSDEDKENIKPNTILQLPDLQTNEFRGSVQLKLNSYKVIDQNNLASFNLSNQDFYIEAPIDIEKEYQELLAILNNVSNETFRKLTLGLIKKYEKDFLIYPAAMSIHHNVIKGLFWHSYSLVKNCLAIKPIYNYAEIDWDLLVCGAILHDIGKVIEIVDVTGVDYSLSGKLIGHISIGNAELVKMAQELNLDTLEDGSINPDLVLLQHMIIASHGKKEFGSPTEPAIIEAVILSTFDNLDARIFKANDELNKIDLNTWTNRIPTEDNRMYLKHFKNKK